MTLTISLGRPIFRLAILRAVGPSKTLAADQIAGQLLETVGTVADLFGGLRLLGFAFQDGPAGVRLGNVIFRSHALGLRSTEGQRRG